LWPQRSALTGELERWCGGGVVEHLHDELLLRAGELLDALDPLLQHRRRATLFGRGCIASQELLDRHTQSAREQRERGDGDAAMAIS